MKNVIFISLFLSMTFFCDILEGLPFKVVNLRCENKLNTVGIDLTNPRLSWNVETSERQLDAIRLSDFSGYR